MVKQVINVGANANDGTGDDLRTAMQKVNSNFTELFGATAEANDLVEDSTPQLGGNLDVQNYTITTSATNGTISIQPNGAGSVKLGSVNINGTTINSDDSNTITIDESLAVTGSATVPILKTNIISSDDSSIIQINDGVQISGVLKSHSVITNSLSSDDSSAIEVADDLLVAGTVSTNSVRTNSLYSEAIQIVDNNISARRSNDDLVLSPSGTGSVNLRGAKITNLGTPTANGDAATKQYVDGVAFGGVGSTTITLVGDDSTGTAISLGESFKIAGTSNITTAVSGDTLTITGPNLSSYLTDVNINIAADDSNTISINNGGTLLFNGEQGITTSTGSDGSVTITGPSLTNYAQKTDTAITIVGDDSTGTAVTIGETLKIAGSTGITTAVSGDTLTITGPNLSSYLTNSTITVVGDDSTGTTLNNGETLKIAGGTGITTAVSGDTLTITGLPQSTVTFVGDDSTGVTLNSGETIKIAGSGGITTSVSGDTLTIDATLTGGSLANLSVTDQTISGTNTNGDIDITPNGTGTINLNVGGQVKITDGTRDFSSVFSVANTQARYNYGLSSFTYKVFNLSLTNQNRVYANSLGGHIVLDNTDLDNNSGQLGWRGTHIDLITDIDGNILLEKALFVADPSSKGANRNNNSGGEIRTYSLGPVALGVQNSIRNTTPETGSLSEATGINSFTIFEHNFDTFSHGAVTVEDFSGVNTAVNLSSNSGTTNITNLVGYRASGNYITNGTGNVTNYYAFYAHDNSEATNNYGIYVENDSYENYLGGLVVKNSTIAANRSNESLYLSTSGTGKVIVNDSMDVVNTLTANTIITNDISSTDSSAIQINDSLNISGTLSADTIDTNTISSGDSSAIQINDSVNISGTLNSATIVNNSISTNEIASADSSAIQINDSVNISGTLNAKTIVTNDLISQDSSVINVLDGMNVSGTLTTSNIDSENVTLTGLLTLGKRTVAQLSLLTPEIGTLAYCTNETGGAQPVFYDGTNWRRMTDLTVIS